MDWIPFIIFGSVLTIGLVVMSVARKSHTDQMERLAQHQRRLRGESLDEDSTVFRTAHTPVSPRLMKMLVLSGLDEQFDRVRWQWIAMAGITGLLAAGVAYYLTMPEVYVFLCLFLGLVFGAAGYITYLKIIGDRRQDKMTRQLPQVLDSMSATLKAGSSITDVFRSTSEMAPEPIRDEFFRARGEVKLNKPLIEVIREMSERIVTRDFKFFVQAVTISDQTGADLADIVASIAETLRDRFRLRDMVNSMTAQGKLTALLVGILPYLLSFFYIVTSPQWIGPLLANPIARLIICGLVLWECMGVFLLWKIVSFKV